MLISKFNLCKSEWLELVFASRNKEYGAYYLRQHYADNVVKAMGITFLGITASALLIGAVIKVKPVTERIISVDNTLYVIPPALPKAKILKAKAAAPKPTTLKPIAPVNTTRSVPPVVVPDAAAEEPPKIDEIKGAVGPVTIKNEGSGTGGAGLETGKNGPDAGNGTSTGPDESVHYGADIMPEPYGGEDGWTNFLRKNLRYPDEALAAEKAGKVLVSFIVEKDGSLSHIIVNRGAGFGMDEEAVRVLKLSKAWKPGKQHGQPVRVSFTIPISFSLSL